MSPRLLVVTNGHGEDVPAAQLVRGLARHGVTISVYPLVGLGGQYPPGIALLDPRRDLPSQGFGLRKGWVSLREDLSQGLLGFWRAQRRTLRAQRGRVDLVVASGDVYCLAMARLAGAPTVLVAGPKSDHIAPHSALEIWLIRRMASQVFARDEATAAALRRRGVRAEFVGTWMIDSLEFSGETFGIPGDRPVITVLPGSKSPAIDNLLPLLRAATGAAARARPVPAVLLSWAPQLPRPALRGAVDALGGAWLDPHRFRFDAIEVRVITDHYADALRRATVVVGMAGAAHEQAAGLGKPIVAFPGAGAQFTPRFLAEQQRLLGDALIATATWEDAAGALARLLADPDERQRRGEAGRERQGQGGGADAIARYLLGRLGLDRLSA